MFANHKYEELPNPKNQKMCNPISSNYLKCESIIVNPVVKMRPSSTSPLASYIYKIIRKYLPQSSLGFSLICMIMTIILNGFFLISDLWTFRKARGVLVTHLYDLYGRTLS